MTVAARVQLARTKRGFSRNKLCGAAGVSNAYVTQLEHSLDEHRTTGTIENPSAAVLERMAAALDVPFMWLAFGTEPEPDWGDRVPDTEPAPAQGAS